MSRQYGRLIKPHFFNVKSEGRFTIPAGTIVEIYDVITYHGQGTRFRECVLRNAGGTFHFIAKESHLEVPKKILWGPLNV